jgi:hypothetical protein
MHHEDEFADLQGVQVEGLGAALGAVRIHEAKLSL